MDEHQLFLFAGAILARGGKTPLASDESAAPQSKLASPRRGHGRGALLKSLRRQRVVYDLGEDKRQCPECQEKLKRIGEEVSERLEYVPASLVVIEEAYQKYACPKGCTVVTAEKPEAPIERGLPGPGLLAHVAVSKYGDHLPLYRQQEIFHRQGVELSRQTMCDWMRDCADLVSPLYELMKERVLDSKAVQTDDTPVPVLDPELPRTGRIWTYVGDDEHPAGRHHFRASVIRLKATMPGSSFPTLLSPKIRARPWRDGWLRKRSRAAATAWSAAAIRVAGS